ncbi:MAG: glycine--tRNA ligase subunit beta [Desulfobacterales bacterium C00003060]|nr:MAG: glycine--tRNA ligase subunit beta [Desulfobacterales bacterium S5133MH4]OEU79668.1 MAG: glycine--tRNA ligase subunit beta [Desulfobacterales bacterium C00003060]
MSTTLLIEIVTEEIPAGYIAPALEAMASLMDQKLSQARIEFATGGETFGTPRRLVLMVRDVAERQASITKEVLGPKKMVAFDAEGRPTRAAEGFAKSQGVSVNRLTTKITAKGEYVCVKKVERGLASWRLLQGIIPEVITAIPFPKSMRWADLCLTFARPIHSILALFGDRIIPFKLENIRSGRRTVGHRFMHPEPIAISDFSEYVGALRSARVVVDISERKDMIREEIEETARKLGGKVISDDDLLDTVTHLVEYPAVSGGTFDKVFLKLPGEVLITAMREHQKYFAVTSSDHQLMPCFIAVNNTPAEDLDVVTCGHERVLRARLEDARFFFEADTRTPSHEMVERLKGVLFQAKLGTMFEKVCRVQKLAEFLAELTDPEIKTTVSRAAWLCKSDLTTQMVNEFPKLQGVMGRIYAAGSGEPEVTAKAIEEHYLPAFAGGPLPETLAGALLSIADKIDTICSCFTVGLIPTGTSDPYALRRQAVGIIQIMLDRAFSFSLKGLINKGLQLLHDKTSADTEQTAQKVLTFFQHRMEHLLAEEGFARDIIAAVLSASMDNIPSVRKRTGALEALKAKPDFQPLAIAFKRVANIIKQAQQRGEVVSGDVKKHQGIDPGLFHEPCEQDLYDAFQKVRQDISEDMKAGGTFDGALLAVATLKGPVDAFFDGVMVLTEDEHLRQNRLFLLGEIAELFTSFADFSKIST